MTDSFQTDSLKPPVSVTGTHSLHHSDSKLECFVCWRGQSTASGDQSHMTSRILVPCVIWFGAVLEAGQVSRIVTHRCTSTPPDLFPWEGSKERMRTPSSAFSSKFQEWHKKKSARGSESVRNCTVTSTGKDMGPQQLASCEKSEGMKKFCNIRTKRWLSLHKDDCN